MQNYKKYAIPSAQLIIADVPYNVGKNFYGSNPMWYNGGDNKNGESKLAGKAAFNSDFNFNLYEYFHFCSKMLKKEPKKAGTRGRSSDAPCMIVFCAFEQMQNMDFTVAEEKPRIFEESAYDYVKKSIANMAKSLGVSEECIRTINKEEYEENTGTEEEEL